MNDNTILRIKVPAHLYESVKKQLTLTEAKKGGKTYGDWTVVKEKKAPKDGMKKVVEGLRDGMYNDFAKWKESFPEDTEFKEENGYMMAKDKSGKELGKWNPSSMLGSHADDFQYKSLEEAPAKKHRSLDELKKAKKHLEKKINEMENSSAKIDEIDPKFQGAMDVLNSIPGINKIAEIDPFLAGVGLVGLLVGGVVASPKIEKGIKFLMNKIKDPEKKAQLAATAEKSGLNINQEAGSVEEAKEEKKEEDK
jgi:hypothetical protein